MDVSLGKPGLDVFPNGQRLRVGDEGVRWLKGGSATGAAQGRLPFPGGSKACVQGGWSGGWGLQSSAQGQRKASVKPGCGARSPGSSEQHSGALATGTGSPSVGRAPALPGWLAGSRTPAVRSPRRVILDGSPGEEGALLGQSPAEMDRPGVVGAPSASRSLAWLLEPSFRKLGLRSDPLSSPLPLNSQ